MTTTHECVLICIWHSCSKTILSFCAPVTDYVLCCYTLDFVTAGEALGEQKKKRVRVKENMMNLCLGSLDSFFGK